MKNNFITKIIGVTLAFAMMIGGAAGINAVKQAKEVNAASQDGNNVTFTASDFSGLGTANTGSECSKTEYGITISCSKGYGTSEFRVYSGSSFSISSSVGNISALAFTFSGGKTGGLSASYTNIDSATWSQASLGSQARFSQIVVTLAAGDAPETYTVTYNPVSDSGTGTGTIIDTQSPYEPGTTVTVKSSNGFTAPEGKEFSHWYTTASGTGGTRYDPDDTFTINENTTLYAQWSVHEYPNAQTLTITRQSITDDSNMAYANWTPWTQSGVSGFAKVYTNNSALQFNNTMIFNSTSVGGKIISITMTKASGTDRSWAVYGSETATTKESYSLTGYTQISTAKNVTQNGTTWYFPDNTDYPYFVCKMNVSSASYISSIAVRYDPYIAATINGSNTVESGSQWSSTGITENESGNPVNGATYSFEAGNGVTITSSSAENGTFTATGSGVVTVSATKNGYNIASLNVTVELHDPYVVPEKASTSGHTGQFDVIAFEFDNLQTALNVISNNTNVVTISDLTTNGTSGTVKFNFVGAGTTTVSFVHDEQTLATISVSVTLSTVTISGLASTGSVDVGESLNLGSTITVTASGSCGNSVDWVSDDESVATVNENGVVVGVSLGTANITVSAHDYPSATQTCAVTVSMPSDKLILAESIEIGDVVCLASNAVSMQYNGPSSTSTVYGFGVAFASVPNKNCYQLEVCAGNGEGTYAFKIKSGAHENEYLYLPGDSNSLSTSATLNNNSSWTVSIDGDGNATITNVARTDRTIWWNVTSPRFATYKEKSNGDEYKYVQLWKLVSPKTYLDASSTIKTISGVESNGGATVEQVALRFGGVIPVSDWTTINASWPITDFGVMFARQSMLTARSLTSLEAVFRNDADDVAIVHRGSAGTPNANGDNYVFTARLNLEEEDYNEVFYAAPFIVAGGEYYFLQEEHYSVRTLADECLTNGGSSLSTTALTTLKGNN